MKIDDPTFFPKSGNFLLIWIKVSLKKVGFFLLFEPILQADFLDKTLTL